MMRKKMIDISTDMKYTSKVCQNAYVKNQMSKPLAPAEIFT